MGNDIGAIIIGVILIVIGLVVGVLTGIKFVAQTRLLQFLPALQGYFIGAVIAIAFLVSGLFLLVSTSRS